MIVEILLNWIGEKWQLHNRANIHLYLLHAALSQKWSFFALSTNEIMYVLLAGQMVLICHILLVIF